MVHLNVILTVRNPDDVAEVRTLLQRQCEMSRAEPGCERFEVFHSQADPRVFILVECWRDAAAVAAHRQATAFRTVYEPLVLPKVERVPHPSEKVC